MRTSTRSRTRLSRRLAWLAVAGLTTAALLAPGASPVLAAEVAPNSDDIQLVEGNPSCPQGQYASLKIDPWGGNGTYKVDGKDTIQITNATDVSFDWKLVDPGLHLYDIDAVIVKGGPNAYIYFYSNRGDDSDTNLISPDNPGGNQAGISHVEFCFDQKVRPTEAPPTEAPPTDTPPTDAPPTDTPPTDAPPTDTPPTDAPPTDTPPTDAPPTGSVAPTTAPTGEVEPATGKPKVTLPPTDAIGATPAAPTGEGWRMVILAFAGILAAALLLTPASAVIRKDDDRK
jgi:hypothetical protein